MDKEPEGLWTFSMSSSPLAVAAAGAAVEDTSRAAGLSETEAGGFRTAVVELCTEILEYGFDDPEEARLELQMDHHGHRLVVTVDDLGSPMEAERIKAADSSALERLLAEGLADDLKLSRRGKRGNRSELTKRLRTSSVTEYLDIAGHHERLKAEPVPVDAHVEIRFLDPSETVALSECIFHSYGYSYDADWVYEPETIRSMIQKGNLTSVVGASPQGEIVGHLGFRREGPGDLVGESGQAVVDPRYRGHHMLTSMKQFLADWASENGIAGLFSEATAAHPASQRANLELGARETGLLLGYIPSSVSYTAIEKGEPADRISVVLFYLKTGDGPPRPLYTPPNHAGMIRRIAERVGLKSNLVEPPGDARGEGHAELDVRIRTDHNQGLMSLLRSGADAADRIVDRLRYLCLHKVDCIYLDLDLADPAASLLVPKLEKVGFFFGGITPNLRRGGDVLRLQYLNNVELDPENVSVASDFGEELLGYVMDGRREALNRTWRSA